MKKDTEGIKVVVAPEINEKNLEVLYAGAGKAMATKTLLKAQEELERKQELENKVDKDAVIILAYPGMAQEVFTSMYDDYTYTSIYAYNTKFLSKPEIINMYLDEVIAEVESREYCVCFADPEEELINKLHEVGKPFFILYPATATKDDILKKIALRCKRDFNDSHVIENNRAMVDIIFNHDEKIEMIRSHNNSIASSTGVINPELVKKLVSYSEEDRLKVMHALMVAKENGRKQPEDSSEGNTDEVA